MPSPSTAVPLTPVAMPKTPIPLSDADSPMIPAVVPAAPDAVAKPSMAPTDPPAEGADRVASIRLLATKLAVTFWVAKMLFAAKSPSPSRLTMAFGTLAAEGGTSHSRFSVPAFVTGEPVTLKSEAGAFNPTLFTVPLPAVPPGNVCPGANVMMPLFEMESPVSSGVPAPDPNKKSSLPDGLAVLLASVFNCRRKVSFTGCEVELLKAEPVKFRGGEFFPLVAVPPVMDKVSGPRNIPLP